MHREQHAVKDSKAHRAGVNAPQNRRTAPLRRVVQGLAGVFQIGGAVAGGEPAEHQHIVLRGVVVVRWQLVVDEVGDVQIHQLLATQGLQHCLHLSLQYFKLAPRAGHPYKALGRQAAVGQRLQVLGFGHTAGLDVEDAHGYDFCSNRAASRAK